MKKRIYTALVEMAFIIFLFYSNLLMGEFTHSGVAQGRGLFWAVGNIFTWTNFVIAVVAAFIGYIVFEFLRNRF
jgi:hypothetical protein